MAGETPVRMLKPHARDRLSEMMMRTKRQSARTSTLPRRGSAMTMLLTVVALAILIAGVLYVALSGGSADAAGERERDIFEVAVGDFSVTIPANGELTALNQVEIRNPLDVRAVITEIVPEGTQVQAGDILLRLADDELTSQIQNAQIDLINAKNEVEAAEKELDIRLSQNASELAQAQLKVELAELALQEWREGTVASRRQDLELAIETAKKDLERLRIKFDEAKNLVEKGFISQDEYRQDEISFVRAESNVQKAELDLWVYENYQHKREEKQNLSDLEQAQEELLRVKARHEAEISRQMASLDARRSQYEIRAQRLADFERQLKQTVVTAPRAGLVVYATSMEAGRWDQNDTLQAGTELRKNQEVIFLPDMSQLVAEVSVHETLAGRIDKGQRVTVVSDAMPNRTLTGEVMSVSVLARTGGWRDPNRRDYTVRVLLNDIDALGLKPSMRCRAEIHLDRVDDALHVPLQAIFRNGPVAYVYVEQGGGFAQKAVQVGRTSELFAEIRSGLESGERVLLREPASEEVIARLPVTPRTQRSGSGGEGAGGTPISLEGAGNRSNAGGAAAPAPGGSGEQPQRRRGTAGGPPRGGNTNPATPGGANGSDGGATSNPPAQPTTPGSDS